MVPARNFLHINFPPRLSLTLLLTAREVALTQRSHQHPQGGEVGESTQSIGCNGFRMDLKK